MLIESTTAIHTPFEKKYEPLLQLSPTLTLEENVAIIAKERISQNSSWVDKLLLRDNIISQLKAACHYWNTIIDEDLEKVRFTPKKLKEMQSIAHTILFKHLRPAFSAQNNKLIPELQRTETLLTRVISAPLIVRLAANSQTCCFLSPFNEAAKAENFNLQKKKQTEDLLLASEILDGSCNVDTEETCRVISEIDNTDVLQEIGQRLNDNSILDLINSLRSNSNQHWKLGLLLVFLLFKHFKSAINALDNRDILRLRTALKDIDKITQTALDKAIATIRKKLTDECNKTRQRIDRIADFWRDFLSECGTLKFQNNDLQEVENIKTEIEITIKITKKLEQFITGIPTRNDVKHVICSGLKKDYHDMLIRVTPDEYNGEDDSDNETIPATSSPAGHIYHLIYRYVFHDEECFNDSEAYEIFSSWAIITTKDYRDVGLVEETVLEENVYKTGWENLQKLGVTTIVDWKRLNIFNREMLEEYLKKPEIKEKINPTNKA